jgi:hypothetical protein
MRPVFSWVSSKRYSVEPLSCNKTNSLLESLGVQI